MKKIFLKKDLFHDTFTIVENTSYATHTAFSNDDFERLKERLKEYEEEVEVLSKGIRKESNQEQDIMPKKFHTGYILTQSNQIDITVKDNGNLVKKEVYESILQTPYNLTFDRNQVEILVLNDVENLELFNKLGLKSFYPLLKHYDVLTEDGKSNVVYDKKIEEFESVEELMKQNTINRENFEKSIDKAVYNLRYRINGKTKHWEIQFNHIDHITEIPWDMTKLTKKDKEKNKKNEVKSEVVQKMSESEAYEEKDVDDVES